MVQRTCPSNTRSCTVRIGWPCTLQEHRVNQDFGRSPHYAMGHCIEHFYFSGVTQTYQTSLDTPPLLKHTFQLALPHPSWVQGLINLMRRGVNPPSWVQGQICGRWACVMVHIRSVAGRLMRWSPSWVQCLIDLCQYKYR